MFHKLQCASLEFMFADHILGMYRVTLCIEFLSSLAVYVRVTVTLVSVTAQGILLSLFALPPTVSDNSC